MQLRFCADTLLCRHIFMQYASVPLMRPLFCAVLSCGRAFALSCFSMRTKPLHGHAFTQLNPLRRRILRSCVLYTAIFLYGHILLCSTILCHLYGHILMRLRFLCSHAFTLYWMEMVLRGTDLRAEVGSLWGWPCPCAVLWVSRPSQPAPLPVGRRRWNPGRIFHGWRPWRAPASPAFPAAGKPPVPPTDPAAGRSRRCR